MLFALKSLTTDNFLCNCDVPVDYKSSWLLQDTRIERGTNLSLQNVAFAHYDFMPIVWRKLYVI